MLRKYIVQLPPALALVAAACCAALLLFFGASHLPRTVSAAGSTEDAVQASSVLASLRIAIDAGHGGYDGGAVGRKTRVMEKEINLDVAQRLRELLRAQGAQVIMTREGDYALCDENPKIRKKLQDMQRRALLITEGKADLVLSIHMNEYTDRRQSGPQIFFRAGCPAGKALAGALQGAMNTALSPARDRHIQSGDYYILTLGVPSALVECGFLSNAKEEALLNDPDYRERVARSIRDGVLAWAALAEHPEPSPAQRR